jgi:hypothetical protein
MARCAQSGKPFDVQRFAGRYATSRFAAAARKWLADHATTVVRESFSPAPPLAIARSWRRDGTGDSGTVAVDVPTLSLAPARKIDLTGHERRFRVSDDKALVLERADVESGVVNLVRHRRAVTTTLLPARSTPEDGSNLVAWVEPGTAVDIETVEFDYDNASWAKVSIPSIETQVYLPLRAGPAGSLQLGTSLREIIVAPAAKGLRSLVDETPILTALAELKAAGRVITHVSVASPQQADPTEADLAAARINHVEYLLRTNGLDESSITSVVGLFAPAGKNLRVYIFGN